MVELFKVKGRERVPIASADYSIKLDMTKIKLITSN